MRHEELGEGRRQHGDNAFAHNGRRLRHGGHHARDGAVGVVVHVVKARHVHALDLRQRTEQRLTRLAAHGLHGARNVQDHLFAFPDGESVDEFGHRFGVVGGMAARDHQRVTLVALFGAQGHPRQVQHVEHVGIKLLVGDADRQDVEILHGVLAFQPVKRQPLAAHHRFHIHPGRKDAVGENVRLVVEQPVEDHPAQIGHRQIVDIGKGHHHTQRDGVPVFAHAVVFPAHVARGLLHGKEHALQCPFDLLRCGKPCLQHCPGNLSGTLALVTA